MPDRVFELHQPASNEGYEAFSRVFLDHGWSRFLPLVSMEILLAAAHQPIPAEYIDAYLRRLEEFPDGLNSPVWPAWQDWTEEQFQADLAENPPEPGEPQTAAEVNEEGRAHLAERISESDSHAAALRCPALRTGTDVITFLSAARLLTPSEGEKAGQVLYMTNPAAPLPEEVLALSPEQLAYEAGLRADRLHRAGR